jgi:hypothetical protein
VQSARFVYQAELHYLHRTRGYSACNLPLGDDHSRANSSMGRRTRSVWAHNWSYYRRSHRPWFVLSNGGDRPEGWQSWDRSSTAQDFRSCGWELLDVLVDLYLARKVEWRAPGRKTKVTPNLRCTRPPKATLWSAGELGRYAPQRTKLKS